MDVWCGRFDRGVARPLRRGRVSAPAPTRLRRIAELALVHIPDARKPRSSRGFSLQTKFWWPVYSLVDGAGDLLPPPKPVSALGVGRIFSGFRIDSLVGEDTEPNQNLSAPPFALFLAKGWEQNLAEHFARQRCQRARVQSVLYGAGLDRRSLEAVDPLARDLQLQGAFDGPQLADLGA